MNRGKSQQQRSSTWRRPKLIAAFFGIVLCADIAASIAIPEHDSIRFFGKYLLLALAIALSLKHAASQEKSTSVKWQITIASFGLWVLGFSANYLSERLYGEIKPFYGNLHNGMYLLKMLFMMWAVLLPECEVESKLDRYCRMSSILLMGAIYAGELVIGIQSSINGISIGIDLFDLTEKYSSICLLITILSIRLYTTHNINLRILYESLLVCMIAQSIIDNNICIKVFLSFSHSMVLWDICVADLPVMLFVILVASNVDLTRWLKIPVHHLFTETATSSLPLILPIMTGFMALLLWKAQPHLVTASAVGVICITTYILQSFIRQIYTQRQLRAAQSEKVLLERIVQEDPVTGVYSRRWFDEMISLGCKDAKEGKPSIVVFMIDVDNFKGYNDTLGHKAGDYCLKAVAIALSGVQGRDRDAVARYGGDEMAAVLFQANVPGALAVAERMRQAVWGLNIPHPKNPHGRVTVSIGIGIAGATPGLITPADLVLAADAALYESKAQGKNTVTLKETRPYDGDVTTAMVMDSAPSQAVLGEASLRIEG